MPRYLEKIILEDIIKDTNNVDELIFIFRRGAKPDLALQKIFELLNDYYSMKLSNVGGCVNHGTTKLLQFWLEQLKGVNLKEERKPTTVYALIGELKSAAPPSVIGLEFIYNIPNRNIPHTVTLGYLNLFYELSDGKLYYHIKFEMMNSGLLKGKPAKDDNLTMKETEDFFTYVSRTQPMMKFIYQSNLPQ